MHMGDWAPHGKGEGVGSECGTPHPNPAPWHRAQMLAWQEFPSPRWPQFPRLHPGREELTLPWTVGRDQWRPTHAGLCPGLFKAEPRDHLPQSCCGKDQSVCLHTRYHNHITHNSRRGEPPQRPRSHGWTDKLWALRAMEYYSASRGRKLTPATTRMSPGDTLRSQTGRSQRQRYYRAQLT